MQAVTIPAHVAPLHYGPYDKVKREKILIAKSFMYVFNGLFHLHLEVLNVNKRLHLSTDRNAV